MENRIFQKTEIGDVPIQPADQAEVPEIAGVTVRVVEIGEAATQVDTQAATKIDVRHLNFYYGAKQALYDVTLPIRERQVTALIGPSGCGKSTFCARSTV